MKNFIQAFLAVLWSFLGIRKRTEFEKDKNLHPFLLIGVGLLMGIAFVVGLMLFIKFIVLA